MRRDPPPILSLEAPFDSLKTERHMDTGIENQRHSGSSFSFVPLSLAGCPPRSSASVLSLCDREWFLVFRVNSSVVRHLGGICKQDAVDGRNGLGSIHLGFPTITIFAER